eukprot:10106-Heterococcus_DN1.PRE.1
MEFQEAPEGLARALWCKNEEGPGAAFGKQIYASRTHLHGAFVEDKCVCNNSDQGSCQQSNPSAHSTAEY